MKKILTTCRWIAPEIPLIIALMTPAAAEVVYLKDGQVIKGAIIQEDDQSVTVQTKHKTWNIKREDIQRILFGEEEMELMYLLMNDGKVVKGYIVDQDNTKVIIRRDKDKAQEETILKKDIKQMSPEEIVLLEPEVAVLGGIYHPLNPGTSELKPSPYALLVTDFNLPYVRNMRIRIAAGFSDCTSAKYDQIKFKVIPVLFGAEYVFKLSFFSIVPHLSLGTAILDYDNGEGKTYRGYKGLGVAGLGFNFELIKNFLFVKTLVEYGIIIDEGTTMSNLFYTAGLGIRF